jgi:site-specific DNA-methyltransferase (adenine-specific)
MKSEVYLMDCMELMAKYPDNHFDLAVVDPPYGLGDKLTQGGTWASKYAKGDASWDIAPPAEYWEELFRVSKNQIVWGGNYFGLPANRCFIIWDKVAHMDTLADCEYAWTSFDRNAKIFKHVRNTSETRIHICQKPIKLYEWIFKNFAKEGNLILDTHVGSGSSRIAAHKSKLDFVGCEIDPDYFAAAEKRYQNFILQQTLDL